jgi:Restriction endonuclease fold toxin 5
MGRLATNALEAAIKAIAVGVAAETAKKQADANTDAKDKSVAKTETTTKEKKACEKCPPDCGKIFERNTAGWPLNSILYQQRICGMPIAPVGKLNEWEWKDVRFDGFRSSLCMLEEAKANYDGFFDALGEFKHPFVKLVFAKMQQEAVDQMDAVRGNPTVSLTWYFQTPVTYKFMQPVLAKAGIVVLLVP